MADDNITFTTRDSPYDTDVARRDGGGPSNNQLRKAEKSPLPGGGAEPVIDLSMVNNMLGALNETLRLATEYAKQQNMATHLARSSPRKVGRRLEFNPEDELDESPRDPRGKQRKRGNDERAQRTRTEHGSTHSDELSSNHNYCEKGRASGEESQGRKTVLRLAGRTEGVEEDDLQRHNPAKRAGEEPKVSSQSKRAKDDEGRKKCPRTTCEVGGRGVETDPGLWKWLNPNGYSSLAEHNLAFAIRSPFIRRIREYKMPLRFKVPHVEKYSGKTDPRDHVRSYKDAMELQTNDDEALCKAFRGSLEGAVTNWFNGLPPDSISSFHELAYFFAKG